MNKTDKEIISEYLEGDENALAILVNRHLPAIYNFARRIAKNDADAEDISQETFFKAWKNLKKFRTEENFKAWLFAIARNTAYDLLRKRRSPAVSFFDNNDGENVLLDQQTDENPLQDEIFEIAENSTLVTEALEKIPDIYREVVFLRYCEELSFPEIGRILGVPLDTVKSRHRRALILLRKIINAPKNK